MSANELALAVRSLLQALPRGALGAALEAGAGQPLKPRVDAEIRAASVIKFRSLVESGESMNSAALHIGVPLCTVRRWELRMSEGGVAALVTRKSPGRPRKASR